MYTVNVNSKQVTLFDLNSNMTATQIATVVLASGVLKHILAPAMVDETGTDFQLIPAYLDSRGVATAVPKKVDLVPQIVQAQIAPHIDQRRYKSSLKRAMGSRGMTQMLTRTSHASKQRRMTEVRHEARLENNENVPILRAISGKPAMHLNFANVIDGYQGAVTAAGRDVLNRMLYGDVGVRFPLVHPAWRQTKIAPQLQALAEEGNRRQAPTYRCMQSLNHRNSWQAGFYEIALTMNDLAEEHMQSLMPDWLETQERKKLVYKPCAAPWMQDVQSVYRHVATHGIVTPRTAGGCHHLFKLDQQ